MTTDQSNCPLHVAALVKQIPVFEEMRLGVDGRLRREGLPLEMSAYCRRAVAQGVQLARSTGGDCTVITLGPPSAEACLREAIAYGADAGVLVSDPAFAGSDTLATARALARTIEVLEAAQQRRFDLVLVGRASVDADTGQVGPELAQLLDLAFATGVRELRLVATDPSSPRVDLRLEHDDSSVDVTVMLPAILSTAERLIDPCKIKDPAAWAAVDPATIRRLDAADLGPGPWGQAGSPTSVGEVREERISRAGIHSTGPLDEQVARAVEFIVDRGALHVGSLHAELAVALPSRSVSAHAGAIGVLIESDRPRLARELLSGAARLAGSTGAAVVAMGSLDVIDSYPELGSWGADALVAWRGAEVEEDIAAAAAAWADQAHPWAILAGSTAWGREVASRVAAAIGAGLTGDAVGFAVEGDRLVCWKPAFGGSLVAAVRAASVVQMATVRAGVLGTFTPRESPVLSVEVHDVVPRRRVVVRGRTREDDVDRLLGADTVIGVGQGVDPSEYPLLQPLADLLGAELAATRKVTDQGWMTHARQIGITGHSISPRLYVAIGTSGKFNHMAGVRSAGTILAINPDAGAPVFDASDIGVVGDWRDVLPKLVERLTDEMATTRPVGRPIPT